MSQQANDAAALEFNGVSQIFSHFAQTALRYARASFAEPAASCPKLPIQVQGFASLPCLMAAAFSNETSSSPSWAVLNKCDAGHNVSIAVGGRAGSGSSFSFACYHATDAGGWAPPPPDFTSLPWQSGPLRPSVELLRASPLNSSSLTLPMPPISLCFVERSSS